MDKVVIGSMRKSAGKTSMIVGIAGALNKKMAYLKPFGDRTLYHKKRLWDYDSALVTHIFGLQEDPVDMSIGFDHSKLRYMYDEEGTRQKLQESIAHVASDKEILFTEGGKDLTYGLSVFLDTLSLTRYTASRLFVVVGGDEDAILDDILFLKKHVDLAGIHLGGIIVNKVQNLEAFRDTHFPVIHKMGVPVIGVIPYQSALTYFSVHYLADQLFAKVITGEGGLKKVVKNILIGAWSANVFLQDPAFKKEGKLVITGGDRTDMILASLESDTSGIILTNNILPPPNIISKAAERDIPLLMVFSDTFQTAKQIENLEPLLTKDDTDKVELLKNLCQKHLDLSAITGS
jgi:BioD-like phosphotransacetylase family protein